MQALSSSSYRFDNFELDLVRRRLLLNGKSVTLAPKAFDMLRVLVEHNGQLLTKEDLFRLVWQDQIVEESNLTVNMSAIRRALGETATSPHYITTVSGRGYYFTADLRSDEDDLLVVENRTVSRVVVEDEVLDDEERPELSVGPPMLRPASDPWSRSLVWAAGGIMVALFGAFLVWYFALRNATPALPFQKISAKRLTTPIVTPPISAPQRLPTPPKTTTMNESMM